MARASSSELQVALQVDHPATTSPRPARCTHSAFRPSPELSRRLLWRGSLPMWVGGPNLERILEALAGVCGRSTWDASPRSASPRHARASSQTEARPQREPQRRQLPPWLSLAAPALLASITWIHAFPTPSTAPRAQVVAGAGARSSAPDCTSSHSSLALATALALALAPSAHRIGGRAGSC